MSARDPAVRVQDLTKSFERRAALENVSFDVRDNEFVALLGPSGCGKSTTLRLVAGLARPSSGRVLYRGVEVGAPVPDAAMVFQSPVLLPWRRTFENVLFTAEMRGLSGNRYRERASELIRLAGLEGFERSFPHELSGGMQQRVAICRALLLEPSLLLMDEPFGALDVISRERMTFELQRIWMTAKSTVLFVTHSITESVLLSDSIVVLSARPGRVKRVIPVGLPRPRTAKTLSDPGFVKLASEVREHIEGEGAFA